MLNAGSLPLAVGNRCAEETAGMDKLLARKYAIKAKGEDADRRDSLTSARSGHPNAFFIRGETDFGGSMKRAKSGACPPRDQVPAITSLIIDLEGLVY
jgi:hypothetical protein